MVVEFDHHRPVADTGHPARRVRRLDRRLELVAAGGAAAIGLVQQMLGQRDLRVIPEACVLLLERHVSPCGVAAGGTARLGIEHQRQHTLGLGLVGQERHHQPAEPDGFARHLGHADVADLAPAFGVGGVDRVEYRLKPLGQLFALGHAKRNAGVLDAGLGPHQPLSHGGGGDQEGGRNVLGGHAEDGLEDQRRPHAALDRGVGTGKHQRQTAVGDGFALFGRGIDLIGDQLHMLLPGDPGLAAADDVDLAAAGDCQQPGVGIVRHAIGGPQPERGGEGFAQRVLGAGDIAGARRQKGDEAAIAFARHALGRAGCLVGQVHFQLASAATTGRISTEP